MKIEKKKRKIEKKKREKDKKNGKCQS